MIFTSIAFLVIALILLIAGVVNSNLALSVAALILSVAAGILLLVANSIYRQMTAAREGEEELEPAPGPFQAAAVGNGQVVAPMAMPMGVPSGPPVHGYPDLTAQQASKLAETLNLDELHGMRRYEVEHANRKVVLAAVDKRVETILSVRRQVQGETVSSS